MSPLPIAVLQLNCNQYHVSLFFFFFTELKIFQFLPALKILANCHIFGAILRQNGAILRRRQTWTFLPRIFHSGFPSISRLASHGSAFACLRPAWPVASPTDWQLISRRSHLVSTAVFILLAFICLTHLWLFLRRPHSIHLTVINQLLRTKSFDWFFWYVLILTSMWRLFSLH